MTRQRADEILRKVIYSVISNPPDMKNSDDAFYVGRMLGMIQRQLEIELSQEVDAESEDKDADSN